MNVVEKNVVSLDSWKLIARFRINTGTVAHMDDIDHEASIKNVHNGVVKAEG